MNNRVLIAFAVLTKKVKRTLRGLEAVSSSILIILSPYANLNFPPPFLPSYPLLFKFLSPLST